MGLSQFAASLPESRRGTVRRCAGPRFGVLPERRHERRHVFQPNTPTSICRLAIPMTSRLIDVTTYSGKESPRSFAERTWRRGGRCQYSENASININLLT